MAKKINENWEIIDAAGYSPVAHVCPPRYRWPFARVSLYFWNETRAARPTLISRGKWRQATQHLARNCDQIFETTRNALKLCGHCECPDHKRGKGLCRVCLAAEQSRSEIFQAGLCGLCETARKGSILDRNMAEVIESTPEISAEKERRALAELVSATPTLTRRQSGRL